MKYNICGSKPILPPPPKSDRKKNHFFQVGVLFLEGDKGRIILDSLPVDFNGTLHVFKPLE